MQFDWSTFNFLEFIVAFLLALSLWFLQLQKKPKFTVEITKPSLIRDNNYKVLNLKITNRKRDGISLVFDHVATQIRLYLYFLDYPSRSEFNKIVARWNSSREPLTPDYQKVDVGLALTNPREVLVTGEEGEISVVIRKQDKESCFPFNNESYLYANRQDYAYAKPEWEIKDDKFIVKVEVQSAEVQNFSKEFLVLNKGTLDQFKITDLAND